MLIIIWSTVSFGYVFLLNISFIFIFQYSDFIFFFFRLYGLMVWCPEYLKLLRATEYKAHKVLFHDEIHQGKTFNGSLENCQYKDSTFLNCK